MGRLPISQLMGRVLLGVGFVILIVVGYMAFTHTGVLSSPTGRSTTQLQLPIATHHSHPTVEAPASLHRIQSTVASQAATSSNPWGITIDSMHGFVWVAEPGCEPAPTCPMAFPGDIGQYALSDGSFIQDFKEPAGYTSPLFVTTDAQGNVWFTQPDSDALGELDPVHGTWNQWQLKKGAVPYDLIFDKQGNLWFTEFKGNAIAYFNPQTHKLVENPIPTAASNPYGITRDPQGNLWFTENRAGVGQIGSFTPTASGVATIIEHTVPTLQPHLITSDRMGNIWFSEAFGGTVGELVPASGIRRTYAVSLGICPNPAVCHGTHISGIAADKLGRVWFDDSLSSRVGYIVPATGQIQAIKLGRSDAHPHDGLAVDNNNTLWFTEQNAFVLTMWPANTVK